MEQQKGIQDGLIGNEDRYKSYLSTGFEFEFATYAHSEELPSHEPLAAHKGISDLHPNLNFDLETDNNYEIEIGIPPLYFKRDDDPKGKLNKAHTDLRAVLNEAREDTIGGSDQSLKKLTEVLSSKGIGGESWNLEPIAANMNLDTKRIKHPNNDQIYGQVNVPMTAAEAAEIMHKIREKWIANPNSIESGPVGTFFSKVVGSPETASANNPDAIFKQLTTKMIGSLYAIPAILFRKDPKYSQALGRLPEAWQMESTIKELYSVWIKASNEDILKAIPQGDADRSEFVISLQAGAQAVQDEIKAMLDTLVHPAAALIEEKINKEKCISFIKSQSNLTPFIQDLEAKLGADGATLTTTIDGVKDYFKPENLVNALNANISDEAEKWSTGELDGYAESAFDGLNPLAAWNPLKTAINNLSALVRTEILAKVKAEMDQLFNRIKEQPATTMGAKPTKPWAEEFGSGQGVRKETFLAAMGENQEYLLTEIRSDPAMKYWMDSL